MSKYLVKGTETENRPETIVQHQFNDNAIRHTRTLTEAMGLLNLGIHLVRIEPGKDSTTHHYHEDDEEFIYVLEGSGTAQINNEQFAISGGDFMAFPTGGPAHSLHNSSNQDLVYLVGGECHLPDVVHYPELKRTMLKSLEGRQWSNWDDLHDLPPR